MAELYPVQPVLLIPQDLIESPLTTMSASSAAALMPASNLKVPHPTERWRSTSVANTPWVEADLGARHVDWDTVVLMGYRGAQSRNMLRAADDLDTGQGWTRTNFTIPDSTSRFVKEVNRGILFNRWLATSTAQVVASQSWASMPGVSSTSGIPLMYLTLEVMATQASVSDLDVRLELIGTTGQARVDFDLSAVSSGNATASGGWTMVSHKATQLNNLVVYCRMTVITVAEATMQTRVRLITPAGSTTIPIGNDMKIGAPFLSITQSGATGITAQRYAREPIEYALSDHHGTGPHVRFFYGNLTDPTSSQKLSDWRPFPMRNQLRDWPRYDHYWKIAELPTGEDPPVSDRFIRAEFWDPNNTNGYIQLNRMIVGRSARLGDYHRAQEYIVNESGGEQEVDSGDMYRPQRGVRRGIRFDLAFVDQRRAMDQLHWIQRRRGRSRFMFAVGAEVFDPPACADEEFQFPINQAAWQQERTIYGFIDRVDPMPTVLTNNRYRWSFTIVEASPTPAS